MVDISQSRQDSREVKVQLSGRRSWIVFTARMISIWSAVVVDLGLMWFMWGRSDWAPEPGANVEHFWVRTFIFGFTPYVIIQQWTLSITTARDSDVVATIDKFMALSPMIVVVGLELYWLGAEGTLSWRHHVIGLVYAAYSFSDYFSTDVINQRLRARQLGVGV
jgi:hypothetical protein